jgi:hypothetical protein
VTRSLETMTRTWDPSTSHDAAQSISPEDLNDLEDTILFTLQHAKLADHELVAIVAPVAHVTPQRVRTIRNYLALAGMVEPTGMYHLTESGRKAMVWQAVAA